jgi:hypothetical protein
VNFVYAQRLQVLDQAEHLLDHQTPHLQSFAPGGCRGISQNTAGEILATCAHHSALS